MTRVIGARELEQLAVGASLTIPENAIITPLAKDIIREKRLKVTTSEADAELARRERAAELETAEAALDSALGQEVVPPTSVTGQAGSRQMSDADAASIVEATIKHILSEELLKKVETPDAIKFAVFGPDGAALLRSVLDAVASSGCKIERLSGRAVAGLFVLAVAVTHEPDARNETRASLQRRLAGRGAEPLFTE